MKNINFKKVLLVLGVGMGIVGQAHAWDVETCYILQDACFKGYSHACDLYYSGC